MFRPLFRLRSYAIRRPRPDLVAARGRGGQISLPPLPGLNYTIGGKRYRHGYQGQYADADAETGYES